MIRERIADDIYVFTSQRYAQVTCGAILTKDGVVLIDTLFYPDECQAVQEFLETRLGHKILYVINTHYHADHTMGTYLYPNATIISHQRCRKLLDTAGRVGLQNTQDQNNDFDDVSIVLPSLTLNKGHLDITVGKQTIRLIHMPGHSDDLIGVYLLKSGILFASDTMMPVPTFFDGSYMDLMNTYDLLESLAPDTVVQGHGEVILRGEITQLIESNRYYMTKIREEVEQVIADNHPPKILDNISIESCGKSRIPLNGLVTSLHTANLHRLYAELTQK